MYIGGVKRAGRGTRFVSSRVVQVVLLKSPELESDSERPIFKMEKNNPTHPGSNPSQLG